MKIKRKLLTFLMTLAFAIVFAGGTKSYAADMIPLSTNTEVKNSLQSTDEVLYYSFTSDRVGYFNINLRKADPTADAKWGWNVELYDKDGICLKSYSGIQTTFTSANLNYAPGKQMYIKIYPKNTYYAYAPTGVEFILSVSSTADPSWEQEENNDMASATTLLPNVAKKGTLIWTEDPDYYVYTIDRTGYFTIDLGKVDPTADAKWGWKLELYDTSGNYLYDYSGVTTTVTTQKFNFKKGTKLYIKVTSKNGYYAYAPTDVHYSIKVNAVSKSNWELETRKSSSDTWKNRIAGVSKLSSKKRYGSLWENDDNDVYKLSVPKTGKITLKFYPNNVETNVGWGYNIEIYNKSGECGKTFSGIKTNFKETLYAKKGTYYVVVKAKNSYYAYAPSSMDAYAITATSKASTVPSMKSKKLSYTKSTSTLKWSKTKNIDGYEIQLCKNKKFKKSKTTVYTTSEKSYKLGWSVARGTYYVRVRAYRETVTGAKLYGKFTKVKKIVKK